jgi:carbonic anhydrase/acetyltransferase-like protein (isoleucine patch superfamily)
MPVFALEGVAPQFDDEASLWLAPDATLIGRVRLGRDVGIWFGAVLRGDNEPIIVGERTNMQEHVIVHTDPGYPVTVGAGCTIGHRALLHGCTIGDNSLVGMGAILLNGATVGHDSIVAAGSLLVEGAQIPPRSLVMGSPGKVRRELTDAEIASIRDYADRYVGYRLDYMSPAPINS